MESGETSALNVQVDNGESPEYTVITVESVNKRGMLSTITSLFRDLGIDVIRADVGSMKDQIMDKFYVKDESTGQQITDLENVKKCVQTMLSTRPKGRKPTRPTFSVPEGRRAREGLYTLMGACQWRV